MIEGLVKREKGIKEEKSHTTQKKDGEEQPWLWYPTLTLNLDIKKALPPEGVEWLHVRVQTKHIKNGRYDYEVMIFDQSGDLIALSHHVAMVLDGTRNTAKRVTGGSSKI
ncbi:hypothetical protein NPX13_g10517 [Xylaria arbuscula]|uniref:Acyl-CoA thioesterase-like C-terminal domain-containing protein n=1 Tax=Xylaria arbuscula TaxID=114810 RepID=A0A9W8N4W5_9PEZI|nr:hypothetical protein NPX13_g10517 [Xylaria arbuscula]